MNKKIVIIGAGAAGIAAGTKLMDNGLTNITILEAENRLGGRIHTVSTASGIIDMGAQWCHGEKLNVVYEMAKDHNLLQPESFQYDGFDFILSDGADVKKDITNRLLALINMILEETEAMKQYKGSLGSFILERYNSALKTDDFNDINPMISKQFIEFYQKYENSVEASDTWFDTSCATFNQYWECEGHRLLAWKKGYRTVFDLLMRKIPNLKNSIPIEENIQYGKIVRKINWNSESEKPVTIECTDQTIYDADHVIVTVSLGVLKEKHLSIFEPQLPDIKQKAIEGLGFGTVDKIYINFRKPFWPANWNGFSLMWTDDMLDDVRRMQNNWLEDIFGFYTVGYSSNTLCGWISGANARRIELVPENELRRDIMFLLRKYLKKWRVPEPLSIEISKWHSNPNFRGSYSYRSIESDLLNTSAKNLAMPILSTLNRPIIQFAGEATSDHYYSTVHGAIETGWREAMRLVNIYKTTVDDMKIKNPNGRSVKDGGGIEINQTAVDVLILGAGLAGLGAATKLKNSGLSFLILEAQSKAGGRVNTMDMLTYIVDQNKKSEHSDRNLMPKDGQQSCDSIVVDSGAQWLHGKYNYLHEVADRHNLLIAEQSEEGLGAYVRDDGYIFDEYFVKKIDFKIGQILEECEHYARHNEADYPESVNSFLCEQFAIFLNSIKNSEKRILAKQLFDWHRRFQIIDNSCMTLDHVSAKSWGKYSYNGESCQAHYNFRNGFNSAIDALIMELNGKNILFKKEVNEIVCNDNNNINRVTEPKISVKCMGDATTYRANHVLVTFSLGSLKQLLDKNLFRPALPAKMMQTIRDIGFETINKLFIQFDRPWWNSMNGIQLIFRDFNYKNEHWTRHISGFDIMKPGPPNTLLAWVGGQGAVDMEKLSDNEIIADCIALLAKFTKFNVPAPIRYFCTRWHSNPFIAGAYSYISTDCDKNGTSSQQLAEPVTLKDWKTTLIQTDEKDYEIFAQNLIRIDQLHDLVVDENTIQSSIGKHLADMPILLFAGEACHERYFSTAHGAFLSGIEQAEKILEFYKNNISYI